MAEKGGHESWIHFPLGVSMISVLIAETFNRPAPGNTMFKSPRIAVGLSPTRHPMPNAAVSWAFPAATCEACSLREAKMLRKVSEMS